MTSDSDEAARHRPRLEELLLAYLQASEVSTWPGVDGLTLDDVLGSYREAAASGLVPDREMLRRKHGELAAEIDAFFADLGPAASGSVRYVPTPG
jgi:hypothetical protein